MRPWSGRSLLADQARLRVGGLLAGCAIVVVVVAVGVIGLRWHYVTDTIGGVALGTGTACALALILDLSWPRSGRHPLDASRSRRATPRPDSAPDGRRWSRSGPGTS